MTIRTKHIIALRPSRRGFLCGAAGTSLLSLMPLPSEATPDDVKAAIADMFSDRPITDGRVSLTLPPLAENGYSVPLEVEVESPMTPDDFVDQIVIFAEKNPLPNVAQYALGPRAGRARVETRIRLSDSQTLMAIAEMNDGTLWSGTAKTIVTLAACVI